MSLTVIFPGTEALGVSALKNLLLQSFYSEMEMTRSSTMTQILGIY